MKHKNGLVLGKFYPCTLGHQFLINEAIKQCEKLYVLVCTLKSEDINGVLRYNWVKMLCDDNPNIIVIHVEDENPQHPGECDTNDTFYAFWVKTVYSRINQLDVIFTSEEYGNEFAEYLDVEHVLVDLDRKTVPISATQIRSNPFKSWDYIPDIVKSHFTKRVLIIGAESTGKSTLIKNLSDKFNIPFVEEYGRTYTETVKSIHELEYEDFYKIAKKHNDNILEMQLSNPQILLVDTDALETKLYGQLYIDNFKDNRIEDIINSQWFDLILLMDTDIPFVLDKTRQHEKYRNQFTLNIINELNRLERPFVKISGSFDERFEKASDLLKKLKSRKYEYRKK